jgi:thiosulfate/3-mercaptopyruvate sulfurtransferase
MKAIEVRKSDTVVVYDKVGMLSAPRVLWLFKSYGVPSVRILNGSFSKWESENR